MSDFGFHVDGWLASTAAEPLERETLASLRITGGGTIVTEVEDTLAHTVREHINVPAALVASWLLMNWWRLRWEGERRDWSSDWEQAHCTAALGGGYAWPGLTLASDGDFVQLRMHREDSPDAAAVRYLRDVAIEIPAADFESAVDHFVRSVEARVSARIPSERTLAELRAELADERGDATRGLECKLQALSGIHPGDARPEWLVRVKSLMDRAGKGAGEETAATLPLLGGDPAVADQVISAMRDSPVRVRLDQLPGPTGGSLSDLPWKRGALLAHELRHKLGIQSGPISQETLGTLLGVTLPIPPSSTFHLEARRFAGAYRNGSREGYASVLVAKTPPESQRFYLARLIAAACASSPDAYVLPVTGTYTALQKLERSFAQEFLCPWEELDAFINEHGTDEEAIRDAADRYDVSEYVVLTTLVNRGKISRARLPT